MYKQGYIRAVRCLRRRTTPDVPRAGRLGELDQPGVGFRAEDYVWYWERLQVGAARQPVNGDFSHVLRCPV